MALPVGGFIEAEGQPEQVAKVAASHTGRFLAVNDHLKFPPVRSREIPPSR